MDSAADVTIISESMASSLSNIPDPVSSIKIHTAGEGTNFTAKRVGPVEIKLGNFSFSTYVYIGPIGDTMLLGIDILDSLKAEIDLGKKELRWSGGHSLPLFTDKSRVVKPISTPVFLDGRLNIPPSSMVISQVSLKSTLPSEFMWFEPVSDLNVSIASSVHSSSKTPSLSFVNPGTISVNLKKHTQIGTMHSLDWDEIVHHVSTPIEDTVLDVSSQSVLQATVRENELPDTLLELWKNSCANLAYEADKVKIRSLLTEFQDVFATHEFDLGNFTLIQHKIDTGDARPVALPLRRCPIHFAEEEKAHLHKMLDAGIISPSQSAWAAAPVLVRKKDKKIRWCLDFRKLNAVTKKDVFPLPNMSECIDTLDGNVWFSKLDANSAYWQIGIDKDSKEKTAFRTKYGLFEFNKMAFGLVNAPSTYARAMSLVLSGLSWDIVLAYLDDICVLGRSTDEHLKNLRIVFSRFRTYGLKLKPNKSELFRKEIEFLGRSVSAQGTTLTDHSIEAIKNWTVPDSIKAVQRLLGMANFHREYMQDFAGICEPLYLVLKSKKFFWGDPQQKAFEELKKRLASPAILAIPSAGKQFYLDTDSSDYAIGAVLLQLQDGKEKVIAFGSFTLSAAQRRYCTTKKELLAIVRFTHHWRHYLLGVEVICRSDHRALTWLTNFKQMQGQLARWLEELTRYNLVIEYRPGKELAHADALSRINQDTCPVQISASDLPCGGCPACTRLEAKWRSFHDNVDYVKELSAPSVKQINIPDLKMVHGDNLSQVDPEIYVTGMTVHVQQAPSSEQECEALGTTEYIMTEQRKDPNLLFIIEWLTKGIIPEEASVKLAGAEKRFYWTNKDFFFLADQVLYKKGEDVRDILVIPVSLRDEVLHMCHDVPSAAHQGIHRTKERIKRTFFWYKMSKDIKNYVTGCNLCNKSKHASRKNKFPLTQNHAGLPMEKVHLDFIGPLPATLRGNHHILVIVDQFTKWVECIPLPNQTAEVTAKAAIDNFFARFGCAAQIVTDQGTNFESSLFKNICRLLGIHKSRTTAWRPSANGQVERFNLTIKNAIRCYVSKDQHDWDENLPLIASAIRASVNRSTGFTPNRLMLGREISIPTEIVFPNNRIKQNHEEFVTQLEKGLQEAHEVARKTLKAQLKKSKDFYDIGARVEHFKTGDIVYYLDNMRKNKLSHVWIGPCLIINQSSPCNFDILIQNRTEKRVNHDTLKKCNDKVIPKWITHRQELLQKKADITYCICKKPDDGRLMIQCDHCLQWFHHHCMNLTQYKAKQLDCFLCPECNNF